MKLGKSAFGFDFVGGNGALVLLSEISLMLWDLPN